jgi:FKBP-type peptidyl-prolyl cis-trans isomerase
MEVMEKKSAAQIEKDGAEIDAYLKEKGIDAQKTEAGVRYVITQEGEGETAASGQTVSVNYTGYLLDGTHFDSSVKEIAQEKGLYNPAREPYSPYDVTIDQTSVIRGWHDALKVLKKGSKATVYIPSTLGYGPQPYSEVIKENSILVFDLEIVELK